VEDIKIEDYDGIIFVGGSGAESYFSNKKALEIAKEGYEKNKVVGAICIAPAILANAGILKAKKATVWNGKYKEILKKGGAIYTGEPVTIDGKIVTANGPQSASSFGKKIVEVLGR
ncbi:MAG: DJ-1/PfpI family protein, partial [Candidatus Thermoplasmatota archaeon]